MTMQTINASASPEVQMNENFETLSHQSVYGKRHPVTTGLTWGYGGGRWGGIAVTAGTLSLTNAATNYIVVLKSTGAISVSTASTNWDNTELYARVYKLTTAGSVVTATEDHRAGLYGVMGFDTTILAANEATDTSCFVAFVTAASGQLQVKTNTNLTFNSNTGMLTSLAATITTLTATNLSATVPTTGWYSPSADLIRTPNSVTVDDNATITGTLTVSGATITTGNTTALSLTTSGGTGFKINHVASVVNQWQTQGGTTGNEALLLVAGSDTNVNGAFLSQGTGYLRFLTNASVEQLRVTHTALADRYVTITGSAGGNPTISTSAGSLAITPAVVMAGTLTVSGATITQSSSNSGGTNRISVNNTSNTANSVADLLLSVAGALAEDPRILFDISGVRTGVIGFDNSDSDKFKIDMSGGVVGGDTALTIDTSRNTTLAGTLTVSSTATITHSTNTIGLTVKTNDGTAANNSGILLRNVASATASLRTTQLTFDANGADEAGGDYGFAKYTGDNIFSIINQAAGTLILGSSGGTALTINSSNNTTLAGTLTVSGAGPHAIGGATNADVALVATGAFAGSVNAYGLATTYTLSPPVNGDSFLAYLTGTINEAGSGTHANFATLQLNAPSIGAGAATLTNASTLKILNAPTGATNNYALWVAAGSTLLGGTLTVNGAGTNTFTGQITSNDTGNGSSSAFYANGAGNTSLALRDSTQAVDAKLWDISVGADANTLRFRTINDAENSAPSWLVVTRSGATVTNVNFSNGTVTFTANQILGSAAGTLRATDGLRIGADSTNNLIDDASTGAATATLYIGNASINVTSDENLKSNIRPFVDGLGVIRALQPIEYDQDEERPWGDVRHYVGFGARHSHNITPWAVNTQGDSGLPWKMRQEFLMAPTVRAVQQLDERLTALEARMQ